MVEEDVFAQVAVAYEEAAIGNCWGGSAQESQGAVVAGRWQNLNDVMGNKIKEILSPIAALRKRCKRLACLTRTKRHVEDA